MLQNEQVIGELGMQTKNMENKMKQQYWMCICMSRFNRVMKSKRIVLVIPASCWKPFLRSEQDYEKVFIGWEWKKEFIW